MKQWIKYILVGLIFFVMGGLLVFFVDRHTSLIKKEIPMDAVNQAKANVKAKAGNTKKEPTAEKDSKKKPSPSPDKSQPKEHKNKESQKNPQQDDETDESVEYLRSLWPIKKRKAATVSGIKTGALYLSGTSPYGPPSDYKDKIMRPTKSLEIKGAPKPEQPLPPLKGTQLRAKPNNTKLEKIKVSLYQIEVGKFSSLDKALSAKKMLMNEGYGVLIYYQGHITAPDWFFVRLKKTFYEHQAYQEAQNIAKLLKITPSVVVFDSRLPHLK